MAQAPPPAQQMNTDPYLQTGSGAGQWLLRRPASSSTRLILDFFPSACCGDAIVLPEELFTTVPPVLAGKGISEKEWVQWMERFKKTVNDNYVSACCCVTSFLLLVPAPCVCHRLIRQQHQVQLFNEEINKQLFEPRGMYWKTQSSSISLNTDGRGGSDYTEVVYWIAISLTPEDAEQLKKDEHLFGAYWGTHKSVPCCNRWYKCCCCCGQEPQY